MINWYKKVVFENYVNFKGRARRSEYWYFTLLHLIIILTFMAIDKMLGLKTGIHNLYALVVFIPGLAVSVRRLHDIGKSGWLLLIFYTIMISAAVGFLIGGVSAFMPNNNLLGNTSSITTLSISGIVMIVNVAWLLVLHCTAGNQGENEYGSDPKLIEEKIGTN